jgi:hypothetical protein
VVERVFDGRVESPPDGVNRSFWRAGRGGARPSKPYGAETALIRVSQVASAVRVLPQVKFVALYCENVQLWPMYSAPSHTVFPHGTAAL